MFNAQMVMRQFLHMTRHEIGKSEVAGDSITLSIRAIFPSVSVEGDSVVLKSEAETVCLPIDPETFADEFQVLKKLFLASYKESGREILEYSAT